MITTCLYRLLDLWNTGDMIYVVLFCHVSVLNSWQA